MARFSKKKGRKISNISIKTYRFKDYEVLMNEVL